MIVSEFRAAFQSTCQVLEGRRPNDCMNNVGAEAVDPLFVEHDLGESSGSAVDVVRRAGYPWPEQMARKMLRNVEISAISPAINSVSDRPSRLFSAQQETVQRTPGWDWIFTCMVAEMRASGCSILSI